MLEYMLMRPLERPVFDQTREWLATNPDERLLLVVDEAHMYRGAAGPRLAPAAAAAGAAGNRGRSAAGHLRERELH